MPDALRLIYLSISYVPARRASSVQVMKMCEAFASLGHDVTLTAKNTPGRLEAGVGDPFAFYGVEPTFELLRLPRPAWRGGGAVFGLAAARTLWGHRRTADLVFSRDLPGAVLAARMGLRVLFEAHEMPRGRASTALLQRLVRDPHLARLVTISERLRADLDAAGLLPADPTRALVAHDGADPAPAVEGAPPFGRDRDGLQIGYIGSLYPGKGAEVVPPLAERVPEATFHVVGGRERELAEWRRRALPPNVVLHGFVPPGDLERYRQALDVVLLPAQREVMGATGGQSIARWMSPLKLFEYMASGRAIVASDLPVLREVLRDGDNALLVPPDDVGAWAEAVRRLALDDGLRRALGDRARQDLLENYTWRERARAVLAGLPPDPTAA